jgi:hypothetical protein
VVCLRILGIEKSKRMAAFGVRCDCLDKRALSVSNTLGTSLFGPAGAGSRAGSKGRGTPQIHVAQPVLSGGKLKIEFLNT